MTTIHEIAAALNARRSGAGWMARCPAHEDRTPSLSLTERNGRVLVHCHAGCSQEAVIAALRERGLWHEGPCGPGSPGEPADPDRAADLERARYWARATAIFTEWMLETLDSTDPRRRPLTDLLRTLTVGDEAVLGEYRAFRALDPTLAAGLVYAGRMRNARLQRRLARWIQGGMHGEFT